jgi:hypothetical protein
VLYGRLLDKNDYRCEPLTDLSYPVVLLQGSEGRGDRLIESLRGDLYGVLNVSKIPDRDYAGSKSHRKSLAYSSFVRQAGAIAIASTELPILIFAVRADRALYGDHHD